MNRIVAYDEDLSYLTVEPGVTFAKATEYLRERQSANYFFDIGGPPYASLIGNAMERGNSVGRYGDRLLHACALEVVLPTGECLHRDRNLSISSRAASPNGKRVGESEGLLSRAN